MAARVRIDKRSCQSSGNCVAAEPAAFVLDEDSLAGATPAAAALPAERLQAIAAGCPALAIEVEEVDGDG